MEKKKTKRRKRQSLFAAFLLLAWLIGCAAPIQTPDTAPTVTATMYPEITVTETPTVTVTMYPEITVTKTPTATVTPEPVVTVTKTPTAMVTPEPVVTVTETPTATVTPKPVVTVTKTPTAAATPEPVITVTETPEPEGLAELTVHFLDVGQGDCILITCGEDAMLIDAGDNHQGTKVAVYLDSIPIYDLDYVIGTHPDADHIGGLDVVIYRYECGMILMPDCQKETKTYQEVLNSVEAKNYKITIPTAGETYSLGDAVFEIIAPNKSSYSDTNDYSIGIRLTHGENVFLFTGDAEETSEEEMLVLGYELSADVYKAAHHGSRTSNGEAFLAAVAPTYAVISCGEGNDYGHPHAEVLNRLRAAGVQVFRTDEQGTIVVTSDGEALTWNAAPSESWQAGEPKGSAAPTLTPTLTPASTPTPASTGKLTLFVLNNNTKKFHLPDCASAKRIKAENYEERETTADELQKEGYSPCGNCHPK